PRSTSPTACRTKTRASASRCSAACARALTTPGGCRCGARRASSCSTSCCTPTSRRAPCAADPMTDLHQLKRTPFHPRTSVLCLPQNWRRWAGHIAVGSYDLGLEREYWAIRNHAALIDVSPLMKYLIDGPDAA